MSNPQLRARITAAAAVWHYQRGDASAAESLVTVAAKEATTDPADPSLTAPSSAISDARHAVRAAAQTINPNVDGLPAWTTDPLPADQLQLVQEAAATEGWAVLATLIRDHAELITRIDFATTLDILDVLYPNDATLAQLRTLHNLSDELGLDEALSQLDRQHQQQTAIEDWIDTPTWDESFTYLEDHFDTLVANENVQTLLSFDEPAAFQHAGILLLARSGTVEETQSIVTRGDFATTQALAAIEDADLVRLRLITAANPLTIHLPGTGALLVAVLTAAQGHDPQLAITQARAEMTQNQLKANRYRLGELTRHAPPELKPAFAALRDTFTLVNTDGSSEVTSEVLEVVDVDEG